jgi:thiamine biosynthesis protein ThiI
MFERILIRYGELNLKGKNIRSFLDRANHLIREKLEGLDVRLEFRHDRAYVFLNGVEPELVLERLQRVSGLYSFSLITKCSLELDDIATAAVAMIAEKTQKMPVTFKVETKRADKTYPLTSQEITPILAGKILSQAPYLHVDVHDPELTLNVEIRQEGAYLFIGQIRGMGGYPVGIGGKALLMLSGGIDSPVAGYLTMKQGVEIEVIHFESTPLTSIESAQKAIDLVEVLARYAPHDRIKIHLVPFAKLHSAILGAIPESYHITIMRRMMYRIATDIMRKNDCLAIVNGESIGQVASQTLESMNAINHVTDAVVIRPLATYDKLDTMRIARSIGTLEISNRPFEDCCTVYLPKNPVIRPDIATAERYESALTYPSLIEEAVIRTRSIYLRSGTHLDLTGKGLTVGECFE